MLGERLFKNSKGIFIVAIAVLIALYLYNSRHEEFNIEIPSSLNSCVYKETSRLIHSDESSHDISVASLKICNSYVDDFLKGISVNSDEYDTNHSSLSKHYELLIEKKRQH